MPITQLTEIIAEPPKKEIGVENAAIQIRDLTVRFGDTTVLTNVNLDAKEGEFIALVGASGCGKTTLMNVIAGLVPACSGDILVDGKRPLAGRPDIAYVLARDALMPWRTTRENIEYALMLSGFPARNRSEIARNYLAKVGLLEHQDLYPVKLSHGQRQRVALARAFSVDRLVYLLDEPFSALDAQTKLVLHDLLLSLWEASRKTVVFVTHDIGEAVTLADRVIVLGTEGRGIVEEIEVDLARPRSAADLQENEAYHAIYRRAWHALKQGMS